MNIVAWLEGLGLGRYASTFLENEIDDDVLLTLTLEDLRDLGVSIVGHRRKILNAIEDLTRVTENNKDSDGRQPQAPRTAERRQLTILFCDLIGSTELSAELDPEDLADVMRAYQEICSNSINRWGGHVAKYLGDGVLAYFGYPTAHEDDAERSVRAGLDMVAEIGGTPFAHGRNLAARVGIATGSVMVGELIGEGAAQEEAVIGETPNLAARLEALAKPGTVVISPQTRRLVRNLFDYEDLGEHLLKGFSQAITVSCVASARTSPSRFEGRTGGSLTPLVGREHELMLLNDLWRRAVGGEGQLALIAGEAGIGKSRLLEAMLADLKFLEHTHLRYQCSPFHASSALHPLIEQLERAADFKRIDTSDIKLDKLEGLLAGSATDTGDDATLLAALLSLPTERYLKLNLSPQLQKERTLDALINQLRGLTLQRPVLLLFEDLHWIDPTSHELLDRLVEGLEDLRVLVIFTYRPELQPKWIGQPNVHVILLNRLAKRQCAMLINRVARGSNLPDDVIKEIIAKTDGIPLFIEELTKTVLADDGANESGAHQELSGRQRDPSIPETLQDSLMARLDRLPQGREIAQLGAVLGREFTYDMISGLSLIDEAELHDGLDRLVAADLLRQHGTPPRSRYVFKHALIRDSAYQSLLKRTRHQYHEQFARLITAQFQDVACSQPELVAYHFTEGGCLEEAVAFWIRAGASAKGKSANIEATSHYHRGLELVCALADPSERTKRELDLQLGLGAALIAIKYYNHPDVGLAYARAWELCQQLGDYSRGFLALRGQQVHLLGQGELKKSQHFAQEALHVADTLDNDASRVGAHMALGVILFYQGRFQSALTHLDQGSEIYDPDAQKFSDWPGSEPGVQCQFWRMLISWMLGYPGRALKERDISLSSAEAVEHPLTMAQTLCFSSLLHFLRR
ncbi:MAG: AAA family ATPase, partial [Geminicoccaceae bacterium]